MRLGTKSLLLGAHCFFLHPLFVARAWYILYGWPKEFPIWISFIVHDWGYWGKEHMDDACGETHPELGAKIMGKLFDRVPQCCDKPMTPYGVDPLDQNKPAMYRCSTCAYRVEWFSPTLWHDFTLCHSRYYAAALHMPFSKLCVADKLVPVIQPWWCYIPMVMATGEVYEYIQSALNSTNEIFTEFRHEFYSGNIDKHPTLSTLRTWYTALQTYMMEWVDKHKSSNGVDFDTKVRNHDSDIPEEMV